MHMNGVTMQSLADKASCSQFLQTFCLIDNWKGSFGSLMLQKEHILIDIHTIHCMNYFMALHV